MLTSASNWHRPCASNPHRSCLSKKWLDAQVKPAPASDRPLCSLSATRIATNTWPDTEPASGQDLLSVRSLSVSFFSFYFFF
jgi:hypothetical protein